MQSTTETTATDATRLMEALRAGAARRRDIQQRLHWSKDRLEASITAAGAALREYDVPAARAQWLDLAANSPVADDTGARNTPVAGTGATPPDAAALGVPFAALARLQPKLTVLEERCRIGRDPKATLLRDTSYVPPRAFCREWFWARKVQPLLPDLIGSEAKGLHFQLGILEAESSYYVVVDYLRAIMPPCDHPGAPCGH